MNFNGFFYISELGFTVLHSYNEKCMPMLTIITLVLPLTNTKIDFHLVLVSMNTITCLTLSHYTPFIPPSLIFFMLFISLFIIHVRGAWLPSISNFFFFIVSSFVQSPLTLKYKNMLILVYFILFFFITIKIIKYLSMKLT